MIEPGHRLPSDGDSIHINTLKTLNTPADSPDVWELQFYWAPGDIRPAACPAAAAAGERAAAQALEEGMSAEEAAAVTQATLDAHALVVDDETGWPRCAAEGCGWRLCQPGQRPQAFDGQVKDAIRCSCDTPEDAFLERIRARVAERQEADARREALAQLVVLDDTTAIAGGVEGEPVTVTAADGSTIVYRPVTYTRLRRTDPWAPPEAEETTLYVADGAPVDEAVKQLSVVTMEAVKAEAAAEKVGP